MGFDTTELCWKQEIKDGVTWEKIECLPAKDALYGHLSIHGLIDGGDIDIDISYSNHLELEFIPLRTITFTNGICEHKVVTPLNPCRYLKFTFKNQNGSTIKVSLVPCYI